MEQQTRIDRNNIGWYVCFRESCGEPYSAGWKYHWEYLLNNGKVAVQVPKADAHLYYFPTKEAAEEALALHLLGWTGEGEA